MACFLHRFGTRLGTRFGLIFLSGFDRGFRRGCSGWALFFTVITATPAAATPASTPFACAFAILSIVASAGGFVLRFCGRLFVKFFVAQGCNSRKSFLSFNGTTILVGPGVRIRDDRPAARYDLLEPIRIVIFFQKEIRDVKEGVAFQANVDKGGLHAR